jgi:hypothetical protein
MRMGTRLACAIAAACASVASAQTLHLEFGVFGSQGQSPGEISPFAGLRVSGAGIVLSVISAIPLSNAEAADFKLASSVYSDLVAEPETRLSDADFRVLGIDLHLPAPQFLDLGPRSTPQPAYFLATQLAAGPLEAGAGYGDRDLFVHAVPLPPAVYAAGAILLGMVVVRHRRGA